MQIAPTELAEAIRADTPGVVTCATGGIEAAKIRRAVLLSQD